MALFSGKRAPAWGEEKKQSQKPKRGEGQKRPKASKGKQRSRFTAKLPDELIEHVRDAVFWTPGLTVTDLAIGALRAHLKRLEKRRGEPFPPRTGPIRTGRPVKR